MKALPMLDHVMLWAARAFAFFLFVWMMDVLQDAVRSYIWAYQYLIHSHQASHWHWERAVFQSGNYYLLFLLLLTVLWNLSVWWLRKDAGRLYLGLSGALMASAYAWQIMDLLIWHPYLPTGLEWLTSGSALVGFFAMASTAFRAPGQPRIKLTPTMPRRQVSPNTQKGSRPPFFMRLLPNSVNSV